MWFNSAVTPTEQVLSGELDVLTPQNGTSSMKDTLLNLPRTPEVTTFLKI